MAKEEKINLNTADINDLQKLQVWGIPELNTFWSIVPTKIGMM